MLGERIRKARLAKGLTQKQLAEMLNITDATVNRYEKGIRKPDPEMLKAIADVLNVSIDYLLGKTDIPNIHIPESYSQKHEVTKRDLAQYEDFVKHVNAFFMDDKVADEDKEKLFKDISELFWKAKEINKQKYGRKKKKAD
ncbi:helix-turn-helix transcriptional regulator [Thermoanaerobacter sp. CM-CNRG TB177]|uniref:Helix-turn-helix protein n=1 Tax=Caldanaerobacter subterraneus TaxID=911092 RepID=A0A4R2K4P7_9THEO|nr:MULTISPECIES: helix-turn-helix transcriptional regulator [Thermoanaerobacteraceae]MBT1278919.1 helix-turn-helix transcriptional regulator [Thermoanaerobacter sp. CM-CNRG TB177]TCO67474.1 helix-turn-helix protein [Caldanaerobacter subterraneus]